MNSTNTNNENAATQATGETHSQIKNRQSSIVNRQSPASANSAPNKPLPPPKKYLNVFDIPFPKNRTELAALDATREIPFLKAHCSRRGIHVPGPNPTPAEIIPYIQKRLDSHNQNIPQHRTEHSDVYFEWKLTHQDLTEFLQNLRNLLPAPTPPSASSPLNSPPQSQISNLHSVLFGKGIACFERLDLYERIRLALLRAWVSAQNFRPAICGIGA